MLLATLNPKRFSPQASLAAKVPWDPVMDKKTGCKFVGQRVGADMRFLTCLDFLDEYQQYCCTRHHRCTQLRSGQKLWAEFGKKLPRDSMTKGSSFPYVFTSSVPISKLILDNTSGSPGIGQPRINGDCLIVISNRSLLVT